MAIDVKLEVFEGPLDLLLHLIDKNKIDIYDIPISEITDQYLDYVRQMDHEDLDTTSEFMVMAATLIDIKCRMLLPKETTEEGEEIDPRDELVQQLLEYKEFKDLSQQLRDLSDEAGDVITRKRQLPKEVARYEPPVDTAELLDGVTLARLKEIFNDVMRRSEEKIDPIRSKFGHIEREEVSLPDKLDYVQITVRRKRRVTFRSLLQKQSSRMQVVVTFLAILELMKLGKIACTQDEIFGEIDIESTEDIHETSLVGDLYREDAATKMSGAGYD
ncbi:MAG: segregation/condensation protein A [Eubacteriales bacterium]|jgi:segregation and condensation protein A